MKCNITMPEIQTALINDHHFLSEIVQQFLQKLLEKEFTSYIGADRYDRSSERRGYRNGHYERQLKTRAGSIELTIPRDREGSFRTELFERYQRSEKALVLTLAKMYINGVSTRKVSKVVEELCGHEISKSHVSDLSKQLDAGLRQWRSRRLERKYPYLMIDATYQKVREGGRVASVAVYVAIGITEKGQREILGCYTAKSENATEWKEFLKSLKERGLETPTYIVSDNHEGLRQAIIEEFTTSLWQRCQVHYMRNFSDKLGKRHAEDMIPLLRDVLHASDTKSAHALKNVLIERLSEKKLEHVATWIEETIDDAINVLNLPCHHRKRMRSTNMLERFNKEIRRRTRVIRIFPDRDSSTRLISSICQETSESWEGRCYLNFGT